MIFDEDRAWHSQIKKSRTAFSARHKTAFASQTVLAIVRLGTLFMTYQDDHPDRASYDDTRPTRTCRI